MIILSNLIQNNIISIIFNNNNIKFTLRHKLEKKYRPHFIFNNDYYKEISKYSFVCKHWFNHIRSLFSSCSSDRYLSMIHKYNFNKEYSFFQYNNIINLSLVVDEDFRRDKKIIIDYINKFSNLERLIIQTNNMQLVKDITTRYPTLKLELDIFEWHDILCDFSLLESISEQSIDFIHVTVATDTLDEEEDKKQQLLDYSRHYKRVNSIFFFNDEDHDITEDWLLHLSHSDIITNKSLQYITINDDIVYTHNLIKVVKDNDHIISFRASLPLFVYGNSDDDIEENCSYFNNDNDLFLRDNKLEHWIEFCEHLAINRTLKSLHISNSCRRCTHYLSKEIQQQVTENFCLALESNQTLEYLTIPCGILTDSFYHKFSDINQTIYDIHFECYNNKQLELIGEMMKINRTIKTLGISCKNKYPNKDQQQSSIESFINGLRHNQTLKTLIIWDQDYDLYKELLNYKQLKFKIKLNEQYIKP